MPSREENISSLGTAVQRNLAPKYLHRVPSEAPEGAMGPAESAIASITPAWLGACVSVWRQSVAVVVVGRARSVTLRWPLTVGRCC